MHSEFMLSLKPCLKKSKSGRYLSQVSLNSPNIKLFFKHETLSVMLQIKQTSKISVLLPDCQGPIQSL
jgi:hypothetical protein